MAHGTHVKYVLLYSSHIQKYESLIEAFHSAGYSARVINDPELINGSELIHPDLVLFDPDHEKGVLEAYRNSVSISFFPLADTESDVNRFEGNYPFYVIWSLDSDHLSILADRLIRFSMHSQKILRKTRDNIDTIKYSILNDILLSLDDHLRLSDALSTASRYFDSIAHCDILFFYSLWSDNIVLFNGEGVSPRLKDAIHTLSKKYLLENNFDMIDLIPDFRYSNSNDPVSDEGIRDSLLFMCPGSGRFTGILGLLSYHENVYTESEYTFFNEMISGIEMILKHIESIIRKKQEQQFFSVFDQINDLAAIIDFDNNNVYINQCFQNLMGDYRKVIQFDDLKTFFKQNWDAVIKTCFDEKKVYRHKVYIGNDLKDRLVFDSVTDRFRSLPFVENGLILVARDITDNQRVEEIKADLISNVSHELKTPVAIVKEYVSLMADGIGGILSDDHQEFTQIISNNLERLERLINNVFDVMKSDKTRRKPQISKIDIHDLIKEVVDLFKVRYSAKSMILNTEIRDNLPAILSDKDLLIQILVNFVENAYKYSDEGTEVIVYADVTDNNEFYVAVKDHGRGIAKKDHDKVFQRFFRTGLDLERLPGAGLGLSITKDLVEQMGGKIWFKSELNKGSTFYVKIPVSAGR
jgi:signal transduction histidine kinase